ncbi:hypothetical protein GWK91_16340 [Virgibacillus sp. MSP4-1]|uniref:hypothetical protein n=1 Tax=Virgibacillus sp. MSP4-1 TaxID=2700081 RepID=UPI0005C6D940|nr:hypothetical protein [Virgibacillus sp. MSP4-1]QHS24351.1 hypothetical protein GWK91_16340 [Virgibacillus sp. MSP4-1]
MNKTKRYVKSLIFVMLGLLIGEVLLGIIKKGAIDWDSIGSVLFLPFLILFVIFIVSLYKEDQ